MDHHELQIRASQAGAVFTSLAIGTLEAVGMLRTKESRAIVMPDVALTTKKNLIGPLSKPSRE